MKIDQKEIDLDNIKLRYFLFFKLLIIDKIAYLVYSKKSLFCDFPPEPNITTKIVAKKTKFLKNIFENHHFPQKVIPISKATKKTLVFDTIPVFWFILFTVIYILIVVFFIDNIAGGSPWAIAGLMSIVVGQGYTCH